MCEIMVHNTKDVIQRYFLIDGSVIEFTLKEDLEKWVQEFTDKNSGKGLTLPEGTKRTMVVLGNEVTFRTEIVKEIQQIEVQRLKIEVGEVKKV